MDSAVTVAEITAGQRGFLTVAQGRRYGLTRLQLARLADRGVIERLDHGVYAMGAAAQDRLAPMWVAWLAMDAGRWAAERLADLGTAGAISHTSAADVHGIGDLSAAHGVELTFPIRKQTRREGIRLHRRALGAEDVVVVDGLAVTSVERTVVDLLNDGHDREHVASLVSDAIRRDLTDPTTLAARLNPVAGRFGAESGEEFLDQLLGIVGRDFQQLLAQLASRVDVTAAVLAHQPGITAALDRIAQQTRIPIQVPRIQTEAYQSIAALAERMVLPRIDLSASTEL